MVVNFKGYIIVIGVGFIQTLTGNKNQHMKEYLALVVVVVV